MKKIIGFTFAIAVIGGFAACKKSDTICYTCSNSQGVPLGNYCTDTYSDSQLVLLQSQCAFQGATWTQNQ